MFEFQVISSGANVAINKVATQSSTYNNQASYRPSKAIDGDSPTFCHTQSGDSNSSAYWEVLLEKSVMLMKSEFSTDIVALINLIQMVTYANSPQQLSSCMMSRV
jgi:hypothetical protein